jgi:cyclase
MRQRRIIPCLDICEGRVVKGVNFTNLKDVGDPAEIARMYSSAGADELVFLDITAPSQAGSIITEVVARTAEQTSIPLTVGGGIRTAKDFRDILRAGADKISVNTAALKCPKLIFEAAEEFGSHCVIVAIDAKRRNDGGYDVYINGGRVNAGLDAVEWALEVERLGAGEILLTSIGADGTKDGYDVELTKAVTQAVNIPVIASGGAGKLVHFAKIIQLGGADAVLAASLFHFRELEIMDVKKYLATKGIPVRMENKNEL